MDKLVIQGGNSLRGEVAVSGSKNAALPILTASLLAPGTHRIRNVPRLRDIGTSLRLLEHLGVTSERQGTDLLLHTPDPTTHVAPYELVKTMRASVLVLGPLLARLGRARVSLPGGCAIGARPVDRHLTALEALGTEIRLEHGYIEASTRGLKGAKIHFDVPTVGGTENLMMAASLARGTTVLGNAAQEPEIVDLANALRGMGAKISGDGTATIHIEGVESFTPLDHEVIPDRIEMGTFICAVGMVGGDVLIRDGRLDHLTEVVERCRLAGVTVEQAGPVVRVTSSGLTGVDITTQEYPGFPTDMQAQFMAMMTLAGGTSLLRETIFENRFQHVPELRRMGADITVEGNTARVQGVKRLSGAHLTATDLRASASLVIAGLAAEGETHVHRVYHLDRGYEAIEKKLAGVGAAIVRAKDDIL